MKHEQNPVIEKPRTAKQILQQLQQLLKQASKQNTHPWSIELATLGALCAQRPILLDDLLAVLSDRPLKFQRAVEGQQALALLKQLVDFIVQNLDQKSQPAHLLLLHGFEPKTTTAYAQQLGEAVMAFANGLDVMDVDIDTYEGMIPQLFERIGRRGALMLEMADDLAGDESLSAQALAELRVLKEETVIDLVALYHAMATIGQPSLKN